MLMGLYGRSRFIIIIYKRRIQNVSGVYGIWVEYQVCECGIRCVSKVYDVWMKYIEYVNINVHGTEPCDRPITYTEYVEKLLIFWNVQSRRRKYISFSINLIAGANNQMKQNSPLEIIVILRNNETTENWAFRECNNNDFSLKHQKIGYDSFQQILLSSLTRKDFSLAAKPNAMELHSTVSFSGDHT